MAKIDKKMAVFEVLQKNARSCSLPELLTLLGSNFKERSVRRWLSQLVEEGSVLKLGERRGTRYQVVDSGFGSLSEEAIQYVKQPIFRRKPVAYQPKWLHSYQPNKSYYISDSIRRELHRSGTRTDHEEPAGTYARRIYDHLLIDLSYNSSRLEGNTYSLLDTKRLVFEGIGAAGKLNEESVMILNHKEAIRYLVDNSSTLAVSMHTVCTLHYLLSDGLVDTKYGGKLRDHGVRIGGSTYIPYENPGKLQEQFDLIFAKGEQIKDPFEQSFFLLVHLSYLQPFIDVNKRTARLSSNILLIKNNFVPISFNEIEREDYISAILAIYELQEVSPLLELYRYSYLRTCQLYNAKIESLGYDRVRVLYREQRRQILRAIIEKRLIGKAMDTYITEMTRTLIAVEERVEFQEDVYEDIAALSPERIAGLGITPEQLISWQKLALC